MHKGNKVFLIVSAVGFLFFFLVKALPALSQYYPQSFYEEKYNDSLENSLIFRIDNSNFLKNNEYFNDIIQGYTLIGYHLSPKLVFYPSESSTLEAGIHLLKYSGIDAYSKILPILRLSIRPSKSFEIIMGTLKGSTNHKLSEPLFEFEKFYVENVENGLQFLIGSQFYEGDIWINWQEFIFKNDTNQERFTLGLSNRFILLNKDGKHHVSIPLQSIFVHQGGQINETSEPVLSFNNTAIGLNYSYKPQSVSLKKISFEPLFILYYDMESNHDLPFKKGFGIYNQIFARFSTINIKLAHWHGDSYISFRGNRVFHSHSTINLNFSEKNRDLMTLRLDYEKKWTGGIHLGAGFETIYDINNGYLDYWYLFYIHFNRDFFIHKFRK
jgi:hypothetical protein